MRACMDNVDNGWPGRCKKKMLALFANEKSSTICISLRWLATKGWTWKFWEKIILLDTTHVVGVFIKKMGGGGVPYSILQKKTLNFGSFWPRWISALSTRKGNFHPMQSILLQKVASAAEGCRTQSTCQMKSTNECESHLVFASFPKNRHKAIPYIWSLNLQKNPFHQKCFWFRWLGIKTTH